MSRGGQAQLFFSPQSQFRNLKEALPQSQFRNYLRNVAPQPQLRNSAMAFFLKSATSSPQLQVRNLRASLQQFLAYFWPWSSLKLDLFYHQVFFWEDFKGTERILKGQYSTRDIRPLFCSWINPIWTPESYTKRFFNSVENRNTPNLEYESGIHTGSIYDKIGGQKSWATVPLTQVYDCCWNRRL